MGASAYIPDQITYFISRLFFPINISIWITCFLKIILFFLSMIFFAKKIYKTTTLNSILSSSIILILFLISYKFSHFSLFRIEYNHFLSICASLILIPILHTIQDKIKTSILCIVFSIGFLTGISSPASIVICFASCIGVVLSGTIRRSEIIVFLWIVSGLFAGFLIYTHYINPYYLGDRNFLYSYGIGYNSLGIIHNIQTAKGFLFPFIKPFFILENNFFIILALLSLPLYIPILKQTTFKRHNKIIILGLLICFFVCSIFGGIKDSSFYRYFYIFAIMFLLNILLAPRLSRFHPVFLACITLIFFHYIYKNKNQFKINGKQFTSEIELHSPYDVKNLISCVKHQLKNKNNIILGVQNYLSANVSAVFLESNIDVMEITKGGHIRFFMQNIPTKKSRKKKIILATGGSEKYYLSIKPENTIKCKGGKWLLHEYSHELHSQLVMLSDNLLKYYDPPKDILWKLGDTLFSPIGQRVQHTLISKGPGWGLLGRPYRFHQGSYELELIYGFLSNHNQEVEIQCMGNSKIDTSNRIASSLLIPKSIARFKMKFEINEPEKCKKGYRVRIWIDENEELFIHHLVFIPL